MIYLTIWKNRVQKFFDNPKAIIFFLKKKLYYNFIADKYIPEYKNVIFLSYEETINTIIEKNISVVRFGDELFDMIHGVGLYYNDWKQVYDPLLAKRLEQVISSKNEKLLVCFNSEFITKSKKQFKEEGIQDQYHFWTNSKMFLRDYYNKDMVYGSALCFTPRYNTTINYGKLNNYFVKKNIIIITSQISRFKEIHLGLKTLFIEAPKSNAWQKYSDIKNKLILMLEEEKLKETETLILVSMGSAAKILVYDMTLLGYTAWDTGQFFDLAFKEIQSISR
jgi:hypothetical protein